MSVSTCIFKQRWFPDAVCTPAGQSNGFYTQNIFLNFVFDSKQHFES